MRVAIAGYGNLGKGVELAVSSAPDMELAAIITRRDPSAVSPRIAGTAVLSYADAVKYKDNIDVVIICGGSATDLPWMTPELAAHFNIVDSFDTHADIPAHFTKVDAAAKTAGKTAVISVGWDPGLFSIARTYAGAVLPNGSDYTFWGKGVSQGHSDAIRRIDGVADARQYTVPAADALDRVRSGENPDLSTRQKHTRECYVVLEEGADPEKVAREIVEMPKYFSDYDTTVNFVSQEELNKNHSGMPHGGFVIRTGSTGFNDEHKHTIEYSLSLDSNPEFTGSVLTAYARAIYRMNCNGDTGCKTALDIAPALLSPLSGEELRAHML